MCTVRKKKTVCYESKNWLVGVGVSKGVGWGGDGWKFTGKTDMQNDLRRVLRDMNNK